MGLAVMLLSTVELVIGLPVLMKALSLVDLTSLRTDKGRELGKI